MQLRVSEVILFIVQSAVHHPLTNYTFVVIHLIYFISLLYIYVVQ